MILVMLSILEYDYTLLACAAISHSNSLDNRSQKCSQKFVAAIEWIYLSSHLYLHFDFVGSVFFTAFWYGIFEALCLHALNKLDLEMNSSDITFKSTQSVSPTEQFCHISVRYFAQFAFCTMCVNRLSFKRNKLS